MPYKDLTQQKQAQHESYIRNKEKVRLSTKTAKEKRRDFIAAIKEATPCMDCGKKYPHYVMDYDHRDRGTKTKSISTLVYRASMEIIMAEIEKCDLICANCHRERTWGKLA